MVGNENWQQFARESIEQNLYYWPPGIAREATLQTFMQVYEQLGYERCKTSELEPGLQKIAIYTDKNNIPVHVARQLPNDKWASKLGSYEDIEHGTLQGLTGAHPAYGSVVYYMARIATNL